MNGSNNTGIEGLYAGDMHQVVPGEIPSPVFEFGEDEDDATGNTGPYGGEHSTDPTISEVPYQRAIPTELYLIFPEETSCGEISYGLEPPVEHTLHEPEILKRLIHQSLSKIDLLRIEEKPWELLNILELNFQLGEFLAFEEERCPDFDNENYAKYAKLKSDADAYVNSAAINIASDLVRLVINTQVDNTVLESTLLGLHEICIRMPSPLLTQKLNILS